MKIGAWSTTPITQKIQVAKPASMRRSKEMETKTLPKVINAMKVITYEVDSLVEIISNDNLIEPEEVTLEMIMERIEEWASSDLAESRDDLIIYQDQDGGEIEL